MNTRNYSQEVDRLLINSIVNERRARTATQEQITTTDYVMMGVMSVIAIATWLLVPPGGDPANPKR